MIFFSMNNNLLEEEEKLTYTKSIQEKQPPYWGKKFKKLTISTRLEEEKLGTKVASQSKRELRKEDFNFSTLDLRS
jgi:hypothetical protein